MPGLVRDSPVPRARTAGDRHRRQARASYDTDDEAVEHFHVRYRADRIRPRLNSYRHAEQVVHHRRSKG
jgi:hypothetical protein